MKMVTIQLKKQMSDPKSDFEKALYDAELFQLQIE